MAIEWSKKLIPDNDLLAFTLANPEQTSAKVWSLAWGRVYLQDTGILRIEPKQSSSISLVLSAGVHGNETAPLELLNDMVKEILAGELVCSVRLLIIYGNPPAANVGQRFTQVNMNRLFSGAWRQYDGWEAQRAEQIEKVISDFFQQEPNHQKLHYDLHTAIRGSKYPRFAVHPFVGEKSYQQQQFTFLAAAGIDAVLLSHQASTTLSYYSYQEHGAQAFTLELGKVAPFGANDLSKFILIDNALRHLLVESKLAVANLDGLKLFQVVDVLTKDAEDYKLNIPDDLPNFTDFQQGTCLAQSSLSQYVVKQDGDSLVFPNIKLPIGQRSGMVVRAIKSHSIRLE